MTNSIGDDQLEIHLLIRKNRKVSTHERIFGIVAGLGNQHNAVGILLWMLRSVARAGSSHVHRRHLFHRFARHGVQSTTRNGTTNARENVAGRKRKSKCQGLTRTQCSRRIHEVEESQTLQPCVCWSGADSKLQGSDEYFIRYQRFQQPRAETK